MILVKSIQKWVTIDAYFPLGIDYTHPLLGGGFGPGHKVVGGFDFVGNAYNGWRHSECHNFLAYGTQVRTRLGPGQTLWISVTVRYFILLPWYELIHDFQAMGRMLL